MVEIQPPTGEFSGALDNSTVPFNLRDRFMVWFEVGRRLSIGNALILRRIALNEPSRTGVSVIAWP